MIYLRLFYEFAKIGLFTFGGGMATIPFLQNLALRTGWFTLSELTDFIAISESTPGPIAINMATYAGYTASGVLGGAAATLGIIFPALFIMTIIAKFLNEFSDNKYVMRAFYGLRPCVLALIAYAFISVIKVTIFYPGVTSENFTSLVNYKAIVLFVAIYIILNIKSMKKVHPVIFLAVSAVVGMVIYNV